MQGVKGKVVKVMFRVSDEVKDLSLGAKARQPPAPRPRAQKGHARCSVPSVSGPHRRLAQVRPCGWLKMAAPAK